MRRAQLGLCLGFVKPLEATGSAKCCHLTSFPLLFWQSCVCCKLGAGEGD